MSPPKETIMVLKVDLACLRCYKKVKKLLCSFPQIKDQIYNEKQNTVMIKVVCCSPEKIRDKLCCKGRKSIRSIEILEPKKPPPPPPKPADEPPPKPAPTPPPAQKPPPVEKPPKPAPTPPPAKPPPEPAPKPKPAPAPAPCPPPRQDPPMPEPVPCHPANVCCSDCYDGRNTGPCYRGYGVPPPAVPCRPVNVCCSDCYNGRNTGPCYQGYGVPPPPPPPPAAGRWCYDRPPGGYGYDYRPGYCVSRCGDYISEENPTACVIM